MSSIAEMAATAKQQHRADLIAMLGRRNLRCGLADRGFGPCDGSVSLLQADHAIEVGWLREHYQRRRAAGDPLSCLHCDGTGVAAELTVFQSEEPVAEVPCPACSEGAVLFDVLVADARNGWLLCPRHHGLKTAQLIEIPRRLLRPPVFSFARDYRCEHLLERRPFVP